MNKTAKHETLELDPSSAVVEALGRLDLKTLSFVQLKRLHKVLHQTAKNVDLESARRAKGGDSGDTVRVPLQSP